MCLKWKPKTWTKYQQRHRFLSFTISKGRNFHFLQVLMWPSYRMQLVQLADSIGVHWKRFNRLSSLDNWYVNGVYSFQLPIVINSTIPSYPDSIHLNAGVHTSTFILLFGTVLLAWITLLHCRLHCSYGSSGFAVRRDSGCSTSSSSFFPGGVVPGESLVHWIDDGNILHYGLLGIGHGVVGLPQ